MNNKIPANLYDRLEMQRSVQISLESLSRGIDNYRIDVRLSDRFISVVRKLVGTLVDQYTVMAPGGQDHNDLFDKLRHRYQDMLTVLIHRVKTDLDAEHISLLQFAAVMYIIRQVRRQLGDEVREVSTKLADFRNRGATEVLGAQQRLFWLRKNYERILYTINKQLIAQLQRAEDRTLAPIRRQYLGEEYSRIVPAIVTPLHLTGEPSALPLLINEFLMWSANGEDSEFIALNRKVEALLRRFFPKLETPSLDGEGAAESSVSEIYDELGGLFHTQAFLGLAADTKTVIREHFCWFEIPENLLALFDSQSNQEYLTAVRKQAGLGAWWRARRDVRNLDKFIKAFGKLLRKEKLLPQLLACHAMRKSLSPSILERADLKVICQYLSGYVPLAKVEENGSGNNKLKQQQLQVLADLRKTIRQRTNTLDNNDLVKILAEISHYRRELKHYRFAHRAFNRLNLLSNKDDIKLSDSAGTLYKLPTNSEIEEDSDHICHHTILKADVRGSTTVTDELMAKGLNPASFFSTRFFNPINKILESYGANKVFIEGDAIILSFLEHENAPQQWFSVARACGYARDMLKIISSNNRYSQQMGLPLLELGVGICFADTAPRFLYDGDHPIMISGAIGLADRLSGCSWNLRAAVKKGLFNVAVLRIAEGETGKGEKGQHYLLYNVNGVNLDEFAFRKLEKEMSMRSLRVKLNGEDSLFHVGQYPDAKGRKKDLVIREGKVGLWQDSQICEEPASDESYYEVVVNRKVLSLILEKTAQQKSTTAG